MEISFISHSCFKVKGKNVSLVFDPYKPEKLGFKLPKLEADIVCISHSHDDHNYVEGVKGATEGVEPFVVTGPGEYEFKGVHIQAFQTFHDDEEGAKRGKNTIYYVEMDGLFLLHLGDLGHALPQEIIEELNSVDVLMVPVGGTYTIDAKTANEIVSEVEPSFVVPMHYQTPKLTGLSEKLDGVDKFVAEWGSETVKKDSKLKISGRSEMPEETQVVILEPQA